MKSNGKYKRGSQFQGLKTERKIRISRQWYSQVQGSGLSEEDFHMDGFHMRDHITSVVRRVSV